LITLLSDTAYHSFIGEVEALNTTTIRRLTPSRRHQLLAIAPGRAIFTIAIVRDRAETAINWPSKVSGEHRLPLAGIVLEH
jgi:hypothetical protein